jgi:hypothetical protein
MFTLPEMPFTLPTITLPTIHFPSIDFTRLDVNALRNVKLPTGDLAAIDPAKLTATVRDATYMAVGLGVVAFERAQARGNELTATINSRLKEVRELVRSAV